MPSGRNLDTFGVQVKSKNLIPSMSDAQKSLFDELTQLQGMVAINTISGMNALDSYKAAGGKAKSENTKSASVSEILSNPKVKAFIAAMNQEAVSNAVMSRQEMLERLSTLSRVNMSDLISWRTSKLNGEDGEVVEQATWSIKESADLDPLVMSSISELTAGRDGFKVKQHSPLTAMKQLSDMQGYNATKQVEVILTDDFDSLLSDASDD